MKRFLFAAIPTLVIGALALGVYHWYAQERARSGLKISQVAFVQS